jgi:hypothetical protein
MSTEPVHILSLGAGVQSSCLALMAARGEITPMPLAAIFADTSETIRRALEEVHAVHSERTGLTAAAFRVALDRLGVRA